MSSLRCVCAREGKAPVTHTVTGMCVHEHLFHGEACAQHAEFIGGYNDRDGITCSECESAGYPDVLFKAVIKPLAVTG